MQAIVTDKYTWHISATVFPHEAALLESCNYN